jgi:hypothetical protein
MNPGSLTSCPECGSALEEVNLSTAVYDYYVCTNEDCHYEDHETLNTPDWDEEDGYFEDGEEVWWSLPE